VNTQAKDQNPLGSPPEQTSDSARYSLERILIS